MQVYILLCREINAEIYATENIELHVLLSAWDSFRQSVVKNSKMDIKNTTTDYINLNPT